MIIMKPDWRTAITVRKTKCTYCNKEMTEEEMNKKVRGLGVEISDDGEIGCADCIFELEEGIRCQK